MSSVLAPFLEHLNLVLDRLARLGARVDLMPTIRWATVTQSSPLLVQMLGRGVADSDSTDDAS